MLGRDRPPRVVLWGGRPGQDLQFGSSDDLRRARIRARRARLNQLLNDVLASYRSLGDALLATVRPLAGVLQHRPPKSSERHAAEDLARMFLNTDAGERPHVRFHSDAGQRPHIRHTGPPAADDDLSIDDVRPRDVTHGSLWFGCQTPPAGPPARTIFPVNVADDADVLHFDDAVFAQEHPIDPDDLFPSGDVTFTHTITTDLGPLAYAEMLYGRHAMNRHHGHFVPKTGPGGCQHPRSAWSSIDGCQGWRRCEDCGTVITPITYRDNIVASDPGMGA